MVYMAIYNKIKVLIAEKELRENRKLPHRIVAQEIGIPSSVLTLYTSQKVRRYDVQTLEKICRYFECQPGDLLVFSDDAPTKQKAARK
jgi:putative transcriptional regulator